MEWTTEPSLPTLARLFARSGNLCAYPGCHDRIMDESGRLLGAVRYIVAAEQAGASTAQSVSSVHGCQNLILLCMAHAMLVQADPLGHDAGMLQQLKQIHERAVWRPEGSRDYYYARILRNALRRQLHASALVEG